MTSFSNILANHSTWGKCTISSGVQPMAHGCIYHCITHGPWGMFAVSIGVQPMVHGESVLSELLYNPWSMSNIYLCTTHDTWENIQLYSPWFMGMHPTVQPVAHGVCVLFEPVYNPWSMGYITLHSPWPMENVFCFNWCTTHGP